MLLLSMILFKDKKLILGNGYNGLGLLAKSWIVLCSWRNVGLRRSVWETDWTVKN
jgi:hypothetical protein